VGKAIFKYTSPLIDIMNWLILILVIVAIFVVSKFIHFGHTKHKIVTILLILLVAFLYFSFTTVIRSHSVDLKTASGVFDASKIYLSWMVNIFDNVKTVSGNVVKMDWIPQNTSLTGAAISGSSSDDGW
jgi:hypothetical protein